jgi:hypothetical protein
MHLTPFDQILKSWRMKGMVWVCFLALLTNIPGALAANVAEHFDETMPNWGQFLTRRRKGPSKVHTEATTSAAR